VTAHRRGYRFIADVTIADVTVEGPRQHGERGPLVEQAADLRARDSSGLRLPLTALIGREQLVDTVADMLRRRCRLVTLTGPGGIGKTRVALQVASDVAAEFENGAVFVNLAPVHDVSLVLPTIAMTLGVTEVAGTTVEHSLSEQLREREMLLVLDNLEQVVDVAPQLAELARAAPGVVMLTTSRVPLRVSGEVEQPIPVLALPDLALLPAIGELDEVASVRLFVERAKAITPDFALSPGNAGAVAEICVRLDGLPLAIELAAARTRILSPASIASRLKNRLGLLTGGPSDADRRHRTLRDTIDWSYGLLDDPEQRLFRRLGVFAEGCTVPAIEAICCDDQDDGVLDTVEALVQSSLVQTVSTHHGEPRLTMLETTQEFALEQLTVSGELEELRAKHARYFLGLAETLDGNWAEALSDAADFERLDTEHSNLRSAVEWALSGPGDGDAERPDLAARLVAAMSSFWFTRGHWIEAARWVAAAAGSISTDNLALRARVLVAAAELAAEHGDYETGRRFYEESASLFRQAGEDERAASALIRVGDCVYALGDVPTARSLLEQAVELSRSLDRPRLTAAVIANLAELSRAEGDYTESRRLQEAALAMLAATGDENSVKETIVRTNLGNTLVRLGELEAATAILADTLATCQQVVYTEVPLLLIGLAGVAGALGRAERAARLLGAADHIIDDLGAKLWPADRLDYEHHLATARAQIDEATFARAHREGWLLSLDDTVELARRSPFPPRPG
jgi:predicted ATPase